MFWKRSLPGNFNNLTNCILSWYNTIIQEVSQSEHIYTILTLKMCFLKHYSQTTKPRFSFWMCLWRLLLSSKHADIHDHLDEAGQWNTFSSRSNDAIFHSSQVSPYLFTLTRGKSTNNWWFQIVKGSILYPIMMMKLGFFPIE